jgi:hypothetical protein
MREVAEERAATAQNMVRALRGEVARLKEELAIPRAGAPRKAKPGDRRQRQLRQEERLEAEKVELARQRVRAFEQRLAELFERK